MNVEAKLAANRYQVDEDNAHIQLADTSRVPRQVLERLVRACPAGLYSFDADGRLRFDYAGCLECGTCYVLARGTAVKSWEYPRGDMGIEYRRG
jgi:ferredoxin like protein